MKCISEFKIAPCLHNHLHKCNINVAEKRIRNKSLFGHNQHVVKNRSISLIIDLQYDRRQEQIVEPGIKRVKGKQQSNEVSNIIGQEENSNVCEKLKT